MRLAVDISPLLRQSAGVGVYTKKIITELIKNNPNDVFVLFFVGWKNQAPNYLKVYKNVIIKKINWPSKFFNLLQILFAWPKIDQLIKADLYFFPNLQLWRWQSQAKVIVTIHDLSFAIMPWAFSYKMRCWHWLINHKKYLPQTRQIIVPSQSTKDDLISYFNLPPEKITVIYLGVDNVHLPNALEEYQKLMVKWNLPEKFLLFIGTLEPRKNLRLLIDALNYSRIESPLVIVGRLGWLSKNDFKAIVDNPRVRWLSSLTDNERDLLIEHCQALIWPSLYEGFGLPAIEALSKEKVVISGVGGSLAEVSGQYSYGFDSTNGSNIVCALNNLNNLNNLSNKQEVISKYSWRDAAKKLYYIMHETAKNTY